MVDVLICRLTFQILLDVSIFITTNPPCLQVLPRSVPILSAIEGPCTPRDLYHDDKGDTSVQQPWKATAIEVLPIFCKYRVVTLIRVGI